MADSRISQLNPLTTPTASHLLVIADEAAGETKKITFADLTGDFLTAETDPIFTAASGAYNEHIASGAIHFEQGDISITASQVSDFSTGVSGAGAAMAGGAFHDGFSDFVANEHIDWTVDQGATNIHAGNYTNTTYTASDFAHNSLSGLNDGTDYEHLTAAQVAALHAAVTLDASATTGGMSLSGQAISNRAATNAQTGYATASHIAAIEANTEKVSYTKTNVKGHIEHGATAGTTRPTGFTSVEWVGSVEPTNAVNGDTWIDTS